MVLSVQDTFNPKPKLFVLWLFIVSSIIMYGGFTSYYFVFAASKGKGHGLVLPDIFIYSTAILILSSVTLFIASRLKHQKSFIFLMLTFVLGIVFGVMQFKAWLALIQMGATFVNNNAAISIIYVVSFIHLLHILFGLIFILRTSVGVLKRIPDDRLKYRMDFTSIFWHFIDILWIYLYVFLLLNR